MKYIAPYILRTEYECHHCKALPPGIDLKNLQIAYELLFGRFKEIRESWGGPLQISSGYRCTDYQGLLIKQGKSRSPYSVHIFGLALDIDVHDDADVRKLVKIVEMIDPDLRIGYKEYLEKMQSFIHIDMGYLISPKYSQVLREGARW